MKFGKITTLYNLENNNIEFNLELVDNEAYMIKAEIARLFNTTINAVTMNLKSLFKDNRILENEGIREHNIYENDELKSITTLYNLNVIIALSYYLKTDHCNAFQKWIVGIIKESNTYNPNTIKLRKEES